MVEYRKLMEEVDQMRGEPVDVLALVNKWIEEVREHLEAQEKERNRKESIDRLKARRTKLELRLRPK